MRAVVITGHGGNEVVEVRSCERPAMDVVRAALDRLASQQQFGKVGIVIL